MRYCISHDDSTDRAHLFVLTLYVGLLLLGFAKGTVDLILDYLDHVETLFSALLYEGIIIFGEALLLPYALYLLRKFRFSNEGVTITQPLSFKRAKTYAWTDAREICYKELYWDKKSFPAGYIFIILKGNGFSSASVSVRRELYKYRKQVLWMIATDERMREIEKLSGQRVLVHYDSYLKNK